MTTFPFICINLLLFATLSFPTSINGSEQFHTIQVSSLHPSQKCESPQGKDYEAALRVAHVHGPCSSNDDRKQTLEELLSNDEARVAAIHKRQLLPQADASVLPATSGIPLGTGNYVVKVGLGTPAKELTVVFDTGSAFSWTQCKPCRVCYKQVDPIFDPALSSSYTNMSCRSQPCAIISSETGFPAKCSTTTCVYGILYGDNSLSFGYLAKEKLTISKNDVASDFFFGCAKINEGLFGRASGLLGLGRSPLSVITTTAQNYKRVFSYCLPSSMSRTGFLAFGGRGSGSKAQLQYTPISSSYSSVLYGVDIVSISVGGATLPIAPTVFSVAKGIIDSGTVVTRLPPAAYSILRGAVKKAMAKYPPAPPVSILDTCYNITGLTNISYPPVDFTFKGGAVVKLHFRGTFISRVRNAFHICLAFAPNPSPTDVVVFANTQQRTIEVVYDVAGGRIGFVSGGCR